MTKQERERLELQAVRDGWQYVSAAQRWVWRGAVGDDTATVVAGIPQRGWM